LWHDVAVQPMLATYRLHREIDHDPFQLIADQNEDYQSKQEVIIA
jgi:hypothetical protein